MFEDSGENMVKDVEGFLGVEGKWLGRGEVRWDVS